MASFFKLVLHGFLYALAFPFFVVALLFYSLYCLIMFLFEAIRSIFVFFKGGTPFGDLKEDAEAKKILLERQGAEKEETPAPPQPQIYIFNGQPTGQPMKGTQVTPLNPQPTSLGEVDLSTSIKQLGDKGGDN